MTAVLRLFSIHGRFTDYRGDAGSIVSMDDQEIYGIIGEEGFARLVAAFYVQVPKDEVLAPMYPENDLAGAEQRLRDFLIGRFGGPPRYLETTRPSPFALAACPFAIDQQARDRWAALMGRALDQARAAAGGPRRFSANSSLTPRHS
jgi:hemoglobin